MCKHSSLIGRVSPLFGIRCKECGGLFICKQVEVVGSCRLPVPHTDTMVIPTNDFGWYCGESICLREAETSNNAD